MIDDNAATLQTFSGVLRLEGFHVATADTGAAGLQLAMASHFDAILVDLTLPDLTGIEVVRLLKVHGIATPIVVVTAFPTFDSSFDAASAGAVGYVDAPLFGDEIAEVVRQALSGSIPVRHPARSRVLNGRGHDMTTRPNTDTVAFDRRIRVAIQTVSSNLATPPSVDALASNAGLSQSQFRHLFVSLVGLPVGRFVAEQRLQAAANLLTSTDNSVRQIADMLGYKDIKRFRKLFRTRFGFVPTIYRKQFRP